MGVGGEGGNVTRAPADGGGVGSENVEAADGEQGKRDGFGDETGGAFRFLRHGGGRFGSAERENGENHSGEDAGEMIRSVGGIERSGGGRAFSRMDEKRDRHREDDENFDAAENRGDTRGELDAAIGESPDESDRGE